MTHRASHQAWAAESGTEAPSVPVSYLAADVCAILKRRDERFDSEDQLQSWLDEDKVDWNPDDLATALDHLERTGRDLSGSSATPSKDTRRPSSRHSR